MNDEHLSLTTGIYNLDELPLETLIKIQRLYEEKNLPKKLKVFFAQEELSYERISKLIDQYKSEETHQWFVCCNILITSTRGQESKTWKKND